MPTPSKDVLSTAATRDRFAEAVDRAAEALEDAADAVLIRERVAEWEAAGRPGTSLDDYIRERGLDLSEAG